MQFTHNRKQVVTSCHINFLIGFTTPYQIPIQDKVEYFAVVLQEAKY